ncbi:MAG: TPM domain-containing protein [Spirochaetaceae bacterium]
MNNLFTTRRRVLPPILVSILFFACFLSVDLDAQDLPEPEGFVNDFAGVIDSNSEARIEAIARKLQEVSGAEIAVVTVENLEPYGSVEQYSIALAEEWGVGQEDEDNGIIMLMAMEEREVRLEVGYGLEGAIPDSLAGRILENSIIPSLSSGNYGEGFLRGSEAVAGLIAEEYDFDMGDLELKESEVYSGGAPGSGVREEESDGLPFGLVFFLFIMFFGGGRFFLPLFFLSSITGRRHYRGGFGSSGMGGFGGSGFSGFGGGGFGGGGASGSF